MRRAKSVCGCMVHRDTRRAGASVARYDLDAEDRLAGMISWRNDIAANVAVDARSGSPQARLLNERSVRASGPAGVGWHLYANKIIRPGAIE